MPLANLLSKDDDGDGEMDQRHRDYPHDADGHGLYGDCIPLHVSHF
jgi:hypothetical protein